MLLEMKFEYLNKKRFRLNDLTCAMQIKIIHLIEIEINAETHNIGHLAVSIIPQSIAMKSNTIWQQMSFQTTKFPH